MASKVLFLTLVVTLFTVVTSRPEKRDATENVDNIYLDNEALAVIERVRIYRDLKFNIVQFALS